MNKTFMTEWNKVVNIYNERSDLNTSYDVLSETLGNVSIIRMLLEIIENDLLLLNIADNSTLHDNGFYKIVLFRGSGYCLRLHYWTGEKETFSNIHNHRWDFSSAILLGEYFHKIYEEASSSNFYYKYNYKPNNNGYSLKYEGKSSMRINTSQLQKNGSIMTIRNGVLHQIQTDKGIATVTIAVTADPHKDYTSVLSNQKIKILESPDNRVEKLSTDELRAVLLTIKKKLVNNSVVYEKKYNYQ